MSSTRPPPPKNPDRKPLQVKRGEGHDAQRVQNRLSGFDAENCSTIQELRTRYGPGVVNHELKRIAKVLCHVIPNLRVDRDASRDGRVLIKWYDENWDRIRPELDNIQLLDDNEQPLDPARIPPFDTALNV
jgi:hypothetical protein